MIAYDGQTVENGVVIAFDSDEQSDEITIEVSRANQDPLTLRFVYCGGAGGDGWRLLCNEDPADGRMKFSLRSKPYRIITTIPH